MSALVAADAFAAKHLPSGGIGTPEALWGYCPVTGGRNGQSIGSIVSDALSVADFGRLQLGVTHSVTFVVLLNIVNN